MKIKRVIFLEAVFRGFSALQLSQIVFESIGRFCEKIVKTFYMQNCTLFEISLRDPQSKIYFIELTHAGQQIVRLYESDVGP